MLLMKIYFEFFLRGCHQWGPTLNMLGKPPPLGRLYKACFCRNCSLIAFHKTIRTHRSVSGSFLDLFQSLHFWIFMNRHFYSLVELKLHFWICNYCDFPRLIWRTLTKRNSVWCVRENQSGKSVIIIQDFSSFWANLP